MGKTFKDGFNKEKYNHQGKTKKKSKDSNNKLKKFKYEEDDNIHNDRSTLCREDDSSEGDVEV